MSVVPILIDPHEKLHHVCEPITRFDGKLEKLVQNLLDTVRDAKDPIGAGLAAPQIGVLNRVCIARRFTDEYNDTDVNSIDDRVLINPVIKKTSQEKVLGWEGCLSLPDLYVQVERFEKIKIEAFDVNGKKFKLNAAGFFARVIQHEMDHLDGKLITDPDRAVGPILTEKDFNKMLEQRTNL
jgi:peptide deformylase